jgi:phosphoglycolate phosphatase-like HAD superfamily hydrolase
VKPHDANAGLHNRKPAAPALLFDLDGTLVDSVYQHVLAWREALEAAGIELAVWRIHRRIGMSGGLLVNALLRETGHEVSPNEIKNIQRLHAEAYGRLVKQSRASRCTRTVGLLDRHRCSLGDCNERTHGECSPGA